MPTRSTWFAMAGGLLAGAAVVALLPEDRLFLPALPEESSQSTPERWACPMMDFIGTKPGDCPVCGMEMGLVTAGALNREQARRIGLETTEVRKGPAVVTVRAYGSVDYDHRFTRIVIPRVAGRIVRRHMATWGCCELVLAGAPIVDIYSPELIAAQGELQAAMKLGDKQLIANLRERFVRWNLTEVADSILKGGGIADVVTITSPFGGQVLLEDFEMANESVSVGRELMPDTQLLRLVDADKRVLVVHVPETRATWVREGQPVSIESDDKGPLPHLKAVADRVSTEIDASLRTREVRIYIEGAGKELSPGALVSARFRVALAADLTPADAGDASTWGAFALVPKSAVLSTGVRHVAWKLAARSSDGRMRFEPVSLALGPRLEDEDGNDLYVIRAGLSPGDVVATQGAFLIDSQAQLAGSASLLQPAGSSAPVSEHAH